MSHPAASAADRTLDRADLEARIRALGPWFHNLTIRGVQTAPDHFLGDYPSLKWRQFAHAIPADLTGRTVLDIGCNGGFYSIDLAPNTYTVDLKPNGIDKSADVPKQVIVNGNETTRVDIAIDTGIR